MEDRLQLIANRVKGDEWALKMGGETHPTLTDTLEAYFQKTGWKGDFVLSPSTSKLYILKDEEEKPPEPPKTFNIYGE